MDKIFFLGLLSFSCLAFSQEYEFEKVEKRKELAPTFGSTVVKKEEEVSEKPLEEVFPSYSTFVEKYSAEIGIGATYFEPQPDGNWYQRTFPHELNLSSASANIGIVFKVSEKDLIRFGFNYVGRFSSEAIAVGSDANYAECKNEPRDSDCWWPVSHWSGKGNVKEFYLAYDREFNFLGMALIGEVGITTHKIEWQMSVPDWVPERNAKPIPILVKNKNEWNTQPYLGFGSKVGKKSTLMLTLKWLPDETEDYYSLTHGETLNIVLRWVF